MISKRFVHIWCYVFLVFIPISAGFALYIVVKNWRSTWIKNRQPCAHFLWILTMALQDIAWTVILLCNVGENPNPDNLFRAMVVTVVVGYLGYALFFHRIWMCVYKSLLQKSLGALDVWDFLSIRRLRTSNAISNLWVKQRHTLGNSLVMSVVWFII